MSDQNAEDTAAKRNRTMEIRSFRVACGAFLGVSDVEREELQIPGRAIVPTDIRYAPGMFTAMALGKSMAPRIDSGAWLLFHPDKAGTRQDQLVLVEQESLDGDRYTLKRYRSEKRFTADGEWEHEAIFLDSLNSEHSPIRLDDQGTFQIRGWHVGTVLGIQRVEPPRFEHIEDT